MALSESGPGGGGAAVPISTGHGQKFTVKPKRVGRPYRSTSKRWRSSNQSFYARPRGKGR